MKELVEECCDHISCRGHVGMNDLIDRATAQAKSTRLKVALEYRYAKMKVLAEGSAPEEVLCAPFEKGAYPITVLWFEAIHPGTVTYKIKVDTKPCEEAMSVVRQQIEDAIVGPLSFKSTPYTDENAAEPLRKRPDVCMGMSAEAAARFLHERFALPPEKM